MAEQFTKESTAILYPMVFKNAKIYDDPVQIIKTDKKIAKIRMNEDKSKIYTEFDLPDSLRESKTVLCASRTEAKHLYLGAYDNERKVFVFRRVAGIYEPRVCSNKDVEEEQFREYNVKTNGSFFNCSNERIDAGDKIEYLREKNAVLTEHFYLYKMLKRLVIVNTKEFVDAAAYNSRIDKMSIITFLNENTIKFKGRKIIDHEFYDEYLREKRERMLEMYDTIDVAEMKQLLCDNFFLYEELHVKNNYTYKLKGYDEKVEEEQKLPVQNDHVREMIDIMMQKYKMVSFDDLMKNTLLSYQQIREVLNQKNYIKLCNQKYTPLLGEQQPIRIQLLDILK